MKEKEGNYKINKPPLAFFTSKHPYDIPSTIKNEASSLEENHRFMYTVCYTPEGICIVPFKEAIEKQYRRLDWVDAFMLRYLQNKE